MRSKLLAAAAIAIALIAVAGCINYDQELTLKGDGSGNVMVHYNSSAQSMPGKTAEAGAEMQMGAAPKLPFTEDEIKKGYEGAPVTVREIKIEEIDKVPNATYFIDFNNVADLNGKGIFAVEGDKIKQIFSLDKDGDKFNFKQLVNIKMEVDDPSSLSSYKFTYKLNCPGPVVETNGTKGSDGKSVTWEFTLDKLVNTETTMTATYKAGGGFPIGIVILIVVIVVVVVVVIIIIAAAGKKKKKAPAPTPPPAA
jgi:hypothetical protein